MKSKPSDAECNALVIAFEDIETAKTAIEKIHAAGFPLDKIELVTRDVRTEAPEVATPKLHETTVSLLLANTVKCGSIGAGAGLFAGLVTGFPGLILGMTFVGGVTGSFIGGIAGVENATDDNSVNLPTIDEYQELVKNGRCLVVVQGTHDEVMQAEEIVKDVLDIHRHIHAIYGHEYHEHPVRELPKASPIVRDGGKSNATSKQRALECWENEGGEVQVPLLPDDAGSVQSCV